MKVKMNAASRWRMITIQTLFNPSPNPPPSLPQERALNSVSESSPGLSFDHPPDSSPTPSSNSLPNLSPNLSPGGVPLGSSSSSPSLRAQRVCTIFPAGFDGVSSSASGRKVIHSYSPSQFLDLLAANHIGNQHVQHTVVKSAWYCKQKKSALHEFIVLQVEDLKIPGLKNYIALDRNLNLAASPPGVGNLTSCSGAGALDAFRISYDGDLRGFLHECHLSKYVTLEQIDFQPGPSLQIRQLVDLVFHISDQHPKYHPMDTNCYWFTGLIWECMRKMCPAAKHEVHLVGQKGRIAFVRTIPNPLQVRMVLQDLQRTSRPIDPELSQDLKVSVMLLLGCVVG